MSDDANMLDCASALYKLRIAIDDLGSCWLVPDDMRELEHCIIRLHQLLKKTRENRSK
jgi:hypothetical protein